MNKEDYDDEGIYRYEVGTIINDNRDTICTTNDLEIANRYYESTITNRPEYDDTSHVIVFLYDYDKNRNINYYDNFEDS